MSKERRFKDFDLAFEPHPITGDIVKKYDDNDIKQAIIGLVRTNFWERLDENIGVHTEGSLFSLDTFVTRNYLESIIRDVLVFEPRAIIVSVIVDIIEQNKYKVKVVFTTQNSPKQLEVSTLLTK